MSDLISRSELIMRLSDYALQESEKLKDGVKNEQILL